MNTMKSRTAWAAFVVLWVVWFIIIYLFLTAGSCIPKMIRIKAHVEFRRAELIQPVQLVDNFNLIYDSIYLQMYNVNTGDSIRMYTGSDPEVTMAHPRGKWVVEMGTRNDPVFTRHVPFRALGTFDFDSANNVTLYGESSHGLLLVKKGSVDEAPLINWAEANLPAVIYDDGSDYYHIFLRQGFTYYITATSNGNEITGTLFPRKHFTYEWRPAVSLFRLLPPFVSDSIKKI